MKTQRTQSYITHHEKIVSDKCVTFNCMVCADHLQEATWPAMTWPLVQPHVCRLPAGGSKDIFGPLLLTVKDFKATRGYHVS